MALIDGTVVLLVFAVIMTIAVVSALIITPGEYDETRWKVFITTVAALGIGLAFFVNYSNVEYMVKQQELLSIKEQDGIVDEVNEVLALCEEGVDVAPRFISELMPLDVVCRKVRRDNKSLKTVVYKNRLSKKIFYLWQLVVNENKFVKDEDGAFMALFIQWATSRTLRNSWKTSQISLCSQGKIFGDLLFEYAGKVENNTSEDFKNTTKQMMNSDCYKKLFLI